MSEARRKSVVFYRRLKSVLPFCFITFLIPACLFSDYAVRRDLSGWLWSVSAEIRLTCRDSGTQWMVVVCLVSYYTTFFVLARRFKFQTSGFKPETGRESKVEGREQEDSSPSSTLHPPSSFWKRAISSLLTSISSPDFWLCAFVSLVLLRYAFDYQNAAKSLQVIVLLTGIVIGKGIALWAAWPAGRGAKVEGREPSGLSTTNYQPSTEGSVLASRLVGSLAPPTEPGAHGVTHPAINSQPSTLNRAQFVLGVLTLLLAGASLWHPARGMEFFYRGQPRWTGPWDNPNLFGVLMGVGTVLALGLLVSRCRLQVAGCKPPVSCRSCVSWLKILFPILLFSAAGMCGYGLIKSYSRGAWLGAACGLGFLFWIWINREPCELRERRGQKFSNPLSRLWCISRLGSNLVPFSVLSISILIICFWQFRHTESPLARRVFSVGNVNDFSWRNRVAAWEGAGRMMLNKPWFGFGWSKAEEVYSKQYRAARLEEAAAIQMNDYLMLGISAGVPALLCLLVYLGLNFRRGARGEGQEAEELSTFNLQLSTAAKAGALVLLVGFWFDGGLFKLPTAVVFWVLIEMARRADIPVCRCGRLSSRPVHALDAGKHGTGKSSEPAGWKTCPTMLLRWAAGIMAAVAFVLTALHLITPQLAVSDRTLGIARKFIVSPGEKADFEYLVTKPIWSEQPLKVLLQHAHLANYNRALVNWKLNDDLYREFVLSPEINAQPSTFNPQPSGDQSWRRPLWEFFYPRIRKESSLEAAMEIVIRQLREQVKVANKPDAPATILESWQRGVVGDVDFQRLAVAALRSVGIPARLSAAGAVEFWNGAEWKSVPPQQSNR